MKRQHGHAPQRGIDQHGSDSGILPIVPDVALFASDLTGCRPIDPLITELKTRDGVRQVRLEPNGGSLSVTYDPVVMCPDALVRAVRALGYGVCIVRLHFDLGCLPGGAGSARLATALRHTNGVLTAQVNEPASQLTVMYIPGPTDAHRLRDAITRLTHTRLRGDRHDRVRRTHGTDCRPARSVD